MQVRLPLRRATRRSSEIMLVSVVVSLEGDAEAFPLVCYSKLGAAEDVGIGAVKDVL